MIISHLIGDTRTLVSCSLVSHSWYTAAFPHRHNTLITSITCCETNGRFTWPESLVRMGELGFLPFVRKFQIRKYCQLHPGEVSPRLFNRCALRHLSALTNVQQLRIDYLDIPSFVPRIQRYFGHFIPTVRSLALEDPKATCRQLVYFIGLFERLEDLELFRFLSRPHSFPEEDQRDGRGLIPPFIPPLRGRLTIMDSKGADILEEMIDRFGGIRFRWVNLYEVDEMQPLLSACAKTLETLRLYPAYPCGEEITLNSVWVPTDNFTAHLSQREFDLSRLKSLRTLQISAWSIRDAFVAPPSKNPLTYALSTVTSPVFSDVAVFYLEEDVWSAYPLYSNHREMLPIEIAWEAALNYKQFGTYRAMHAVRGFRLVLCAVVWDCDVEFAMRALKRAVETEKVERGFDMFPEPPVVYIPRKSPGGDELWEDDPFYWTPLE